MERYAFRRGAVVIVHSSCNNDNPSKEWVPEEAQTNDIGHLKHLLTRRGFQVVLEMGPTTDLLQPTVVDIEQNISDLASTWKWDDDCFDALIVIIAAHGTLDRITGWPLPGENEKSGPLDLADKVFRHFQLPIQGQSSTRASEALKGKPKVFIMDACRGSTRRTRLQRCETRNIRLRGLPPQASPRAGSTVCQLRKNIKRAGTMMP